MLLAVATAGGGQSASDVKGKNDYSKEPFIIEKSVMRIRFENDGTWTRDTEAAVRMQSEAGVQHYGLLAFGYSSTNDKIDISYVRVRKADGAVIITPPENFQDVAAEVTRQAPMYSDYRERHVAVKGLGVGDKLEYQLRYQVNKPLVPGQFWTEYNFTRSDIILDEELAISVPKGRELKLKSPEVTPVVTENGDRRVYSWKTSNLERPPEEELKEKSNETPPASIQLSTFKSWDEVARWWGALEEEQVQPTAEIRAKATELTQCAKSDAEKLHAIYNYVATHFRYVSLSFGIGRYQPHPAGDVLRNEYGDCKDKHTLLQSLLRASGIDAYPALINSTRKVDADVASPAQFDHVISVVPQGKNLVWLDTTTEVSPFGFLLANQRDKQALVITSGKAASPGAALMASVLGQSPLVKTPADPPFKSDVTFEIDAKLDDKGTLTGKIQRSMRGDAEVILRAAFRQVPQTQWKDLVQQISYGSGFAGDVGEIVVSTPEDTDKPFQLSYSYTRQKYPDWANKRITPPSPLQAIAELKEDKAASADPVELGAPGEISSVSRVEMPSGYTPKLQPPVDIVRDFAEFHATYAFNGGVLTAEYRLVIKTHELPASRRDDYQTFVKSVNKNLQVYTDFESATASAAAPAPSPGPVVAAPNPESARLFQQAREAMQAGNFNGAIGLLEDAVKADPTNKDAWGSLGLLHFNLHQVAEGEAALRKAITLDPKDVRPYEVLAYYYTYSRRRQDAIAVWRELLKIEPENAGAHANLGTLLLDNKNYAEAIPELEAALKADPKRYGVELGLGRAYIGAHDTDKALVAFRRAVEAEPRPSTWNEFAWVLADSGQKLAEAKTYAEKAVTAEEAESATVRLDTLKTADLRRMETLAAYWDTLGWVYFRQEDLSRAANYVGAAWNLWQRADIGDHLVQIYEKQGRKPEAAHLHSMVLSMQDKPPSIRRLGPDEIKRFARTKQGETDLSQMRMVRVPRPAGVKQGSAEFFVLFAQSSKVEDVKFISGAGQLKPLAKQIAAAHYVAPVPEGSQARLVRRGILMCTGTAPRCDFVFVPVDSVFSTN